VFKAYSDEFIIRRGTEETVAGPYRSLFLFAAATLLVFFGAVSFARKYRKQFILIAAIAVYVFVIYSRWRPVGWPWRSWARH
jgi:hypothetical protein